MEKTKQIKSQTQSLLVFNLIFVLLTLFTMIALQGTISTVGIALALIMIVNAVIILVIGFSSSLLLLKGASERESLKHRVACLENNLVRQDERILELDKKTKMFD